MGQAVKIKLEHDKLSGEATVQEAVTEVAAVMGENVRLRRGFLVSSPTGIISSYLHASAHPGVLLNNSENPVIGHATFSGDSRLPWFRVWGFRESFKSCLSLGLIPIITFSARI